MIMTTQSDNPDYIEIALSKQGRKHRGLYSAIVDEIDSDLEGRNWTVLITHNVKYAMHKVSGELLHRLILSRILDRPLLDTEQVDHINLNGLDNRRCNLRLATNTENQRNKSKQVNNTSGYKGVYWRKDSNKWVAQIKVDNEVRHLGRFDTPEEAHAAYCEAAKQLHGEFANFGDT